MPYSPKMELREPLVVATPEQIEAKRDKIKEAAGRAVVRAVETPGVQYAVLCQQKRSGRMVTRIVETGRYFTEEDREGAGGYILGLRVIPEDGVYYRGTLTGEPSLTGLVDEHADNAVAELVEQGAQLYPASSILRPNPVDTQP